MNLQLWSYNYDPEPIGIGPVSATWARAMAERGHQVEVIAAHPHYPEPVWGRRRRPYQEVRDGIPVRRLPIWAGRGSARQRVRQEASYAAALSAYRPFAGRPDAVIAVSPSFPALRPAMVFARRRGIPWLLWLQDILPDGAISSGLLRDGRLIESARRFERRAYESASRIVVISDSFRRNLVGKGVPEEKLTRIYNPASLPVRREPRPEQSIEPGTVLTMGNIGRTQNLAAIARAFQSHAGLEELGAVLTITGDGVAAPEVKAAATTDRVRLTGVLRQADLEQRLTTTAVGLVSQLYGGDDFNVPSKLMNLMAHAIPVVAAVRPDSEVARLIEAAGAGWVTSSPEECAERLAEVLPDADERARRGAAALEFARREFTPEGVAARFEKVLQAAIPRG